MSLVPTANIQDLKAICQAIAAEAQGLCPWAWDDRFEAVLAQCNFEQASRLHPVLQKHFPPAWTVLNCADAPPKVGDVTRALGGIKARQELFLTDKAPFEMALGVAWWPWGDGKSVSLRFFLWPKPDLDFELNEELCSWFGIVKV